MFSKTAAFYDAIYSFKDYAAEAAFVKSLITKHLGPGRHSVLDVACGTGAHIAHLRHDFAVEGLDLDGGLLEIARDRNPGVLFHRQDMSGFEFGKKFDAVVCLFSSIGYARTTARLQSTLRSFAQHVRSGGLVVVEPWFTPEAWKPGTLHSLTIDQLDLKVCRMSRSPAIAPDQTVSMDMHYLVATTEGVEHFIEVHEMGMFNDDQYVEAFELAGLKVERLDEGLMGRGVYVGIKA